MKNQNVCKNCNSPATDKYCSNCGQKVYTGRFTVKAFLIVFFEAFNVERGIIYTFRLLFSNPGKLVRDYLSGKTKSYYNPLKYLIVISGIYTLLVLWTGIFDTSIQNSGVILNHADATENLDIAAQLQLKWMEVFKKIMNFISLLLIPFTSIFTRWFYKKDELYYGEHLIINSFVFGQSLIITVLLMPVIYIIPSSITYFPIIGLASNIIYISYALWRIFDNTLLLSTLKTILILVFGYVLFLIVWFILIALFFLAIVLLKVDITQYL